MGDRISKDWNQLPGQQRGETLIAYFARAHEAYEIYSQFSNLPNHDINQHKVFNANYPHDNEDIDNNDEEAKIVPIPLKAVAAGAGEEAEKESKATLDKLNTAKAAADLFTGILDDLPKLKKKPKKSKSKSKHRSAQT